LNQIIDKVNDMSSQIVSEQPLVGNLSGGRSNWIKLSWKKLLSRKKQLIVAGGAIAILAVAAY